MKSRYQKIVTAFVLVAIIGIVVYYSFPKSDCDEGCSCDKKSDEGFKTHAMRSMMGEKLYTPHVRQHLISYANHPQHNPVKQRFVPVPDSTDSMYDQMKSMRGTPVSKSMDTMTNDQLSPFINYTQ